MLDVRVPSKLRFRLLGQATIAAGDSDTVRISSQKGFALLAYLALHADRPVSRSVLADLLWSDRGEAQARQNLRQSILTLRRDLKTVHSVILQTDDQSVGLAADATEVDALQFAAWATNADPAVRLRCLDIPWGSFLDGFSIESEAFDEWVVAERQRLDTIATRTFSELADQLSAAGDGGRAILALKRLIALDPGEEERHRRLISLEARFRGRDAALTRAKSLTAMLKRELDAEPEAATRALIAEIRTSAEPQRPTARKETVPPPAVEATAPAATAPASDAPEAVPAKPRRYWPVIAAGLLVLVLGSGAAFLLQHRTTPSAGSTDERTAASSQGGESWRSPRLPSQRADDAVAPGRGLVAIAVLPFASYDGHANGRSVIAEMVTDDLTYLLSRIPAFRVISRQTMMSYRDQTVDAGKVGAELGTHYLLEGNASMRGTALRVTVSLIDTRTRLHVWSGSFERAGEDREALQTEIVKTVGRELQYSVMAVEGARASSHPDVNELIFRGYAAIWDSRRYGVEGLRPAEKYFRQALERDPGAVRATIGLAAFHIHMGLQLFAPDPKPHLAKAEEILRPIIARHPNLTEAHAHMGLVHVARSEHSEAIASFERVIALNPSHAPSYAQLGRQLARIGHAKEGLAHIHYAMKLSPRDPVISYWHAFAGYAELELGNYDKAIDYLERAHAANPTQPRTLLTLISANAMAGDLDLARRRLALLQTQHPHMTDVRLQNMYSPKRGKRDSRLVEGIRRVLAAKTARSATSQH
jgi:DNA-binding SARP family transcriptional activator/TolB-like protein/Tfp pilus assembly protein PilF